MTLSTDGAAPTRPPRRALARDAALTATGVGGLLALFAHRRAGLDAGFPRFERPAAWSTLWRAGHLPGASLAGLALVMLASVGLLGLLGDSPLDLRGDERPWRWRHGDAGPWWRDERAWLPLLLAALYLPAAGAFGLWDPWETHYAEVAREMLSRDDWVTPWWGPEGWFLSKPALLPWMIGLGLSAGTLAGTSFLPGASPGAEEWFVRGPVALLSLAAVVALQRAVGAAWGRRAGLWSALALGTSPFWAMVSHQAMTDVPFVATMTLAMAAILRAVTVDPSLAAPPFAVRLGPFALRVSLWHLAVGAVALVALPQALYLLTRPVLLACPDPGDRACADALLASRVGGVQLPVERFFAGSAGNAASPSLPEGVPGALPWVAHYNRLPFAVSAAQGAGWLALGALVLRSLRRERSAQGLFFTLAYVCGGLSFLAKGPAGLGLPELVLALFIVATGRWSLVPRLRLARGLAVFLLCAAPWYVAVSARLGREYFDRFVVHDLLQRALVGVHGDTGTAGYYLQQLAYGLFPWGAAVPFALFATPAGADAGEGRRAALALARLWFAAAFALFSLMVTRFHHYILPAVPAAAVLAGVTLASPDRGAARTAALAALTALAAREMADPSRWLHLFTYDYARPVPPAVLATRPAFVALGALATAAWALRNRRAGAWLLGATAVASAAWALWGYMPVAARHRSQRGLFEAYERARGPSPAPLAAWALNWKGETFYGRGAVAAFACGFPPCGPRDLDRWLDANRGRRVFVLTEHGRVDAVRGHAARVGAVVRPRTTVRDHHHFVLLEVSP